MKKTGTEAGQKARREEAPATHEAYSEPKLEEWGSVTELTQTGRTRPGADAKGGSRPSQGV
jgi:hypothetical protein